MTIYDYNYSLHTAENNFYLNHQGNPTAISDQLWINYQFKFLNTKTLIDNFSQTSQQTNDSLLPLAVRYSSPDGTLHVIERPPFQIEPDFSVAKSYRTRNIPTILQSTKMWIPWTVAIISTAPTSSSFSSSFTFHLYFNDGPLQSFDDLLIPCYLPNSSGGNICMGQDSLGTTQLIQDKASITDIYNHTFNSYFAGWNSDLMSIMRNLEYFNPIIERVASKSKKSATNLNNFGNRYNTQKYFKSLLYLLSQISLEEHLGYITHAKNSPNSTDWYTTLNRHIAENGNGKNYSFTQSYAMASDPYRRLSYPIANEYDLQSMIELSFRVSIRNYDPDSIFKYINNPYIVSCIYKTVKEFSEDSQTSLLLEFDHIDVASYNQPESVS